MRLIKKIGICIIITIGILILNDCYSVFATDIDLKEMTKAQAEAELLRLDVEKNTDKYKDNLIAAFVEADKELINFRKTHDEKFDDNDQSEIDKLTNNLKKAMEKLKAEQKLVSDSYQIFDVQKNENLTFIYYLPVDAIVFSDEKLGETVFLYLDAEKTPIKSSDIIVSSIDENTTKVILKGDYLRTLSIEQHNLHLMPYSVKNDTVTVSFLIRQEAKYETMIMGSQDEFIPMNITNDKVQEWLVKEKIWTSSNESIASVNENGVVSAKGVGQAEIKATYTDGTYDLWIVTVDAYNGIFVTEDFGDFTNGEKQPINWITVKNSGIDFAVLRYAIAYNDGLDSYKYDVYEDELINVIKKAKEQNLKIGIDFKTAALSKQDAIDEAKLLINNLKDIKELIDLPIVYDVNIYGFDTNRMIIAPDVLVKKEDCAIPEKLLQATPIITDVVRAFVNTMLNAGYKTMIYTSKYAPEVLDLKALHDEGVGIVFYNCDSSDYPTIAPIVKDSETADIWFFAGDKYVEGATNENGKTWMLIGYNEYMDSVIEKGIPVEYKTLEGNEQIFNLNKDKNLSFKFDISYDTFINDGKVYIDENYVDRMKYTSQEGSTIITFNDDYIKGLSLGEHEIKVTLNDGKLGSANASFTLNKTIITSNPLTGDNIEIYCLTTIITISSICVLHFLKRKYSIKIKYNK